jgi:hypothetical protein
MKYGIIFIKNKKIFISILEKSYIKTPFNLSFRRFLLIKNAENNIEIYVIYYGNGNK